MKKTAGAVNVANNIKNIEELKTESLRSLAELFAGMSAPPDGDSLQSLAASFANMITVSYLLARRLGLGYGEVNEEILRILERGMAGGDSAELNVRDMDELKKYIAAGDMP